METTDNTLVEMQQQMKQLREKLDAQKIVNDRILRQAMNQTANRLRFKYFVPCIFAVAGIFLAPALMQLGLSLPVVIAYVVMMLAAIAATVIINNHLPRLDRDLVTAASEVSKFRKLNADWYKVGVPVALVWFGFMIWDLIKNVGVDGSQLYGLIGGLSVGLIIGGLFGWKNRRDVLAGADELLDQIEEFRNN